MYWDSPENVICAAIQSPQTPKMACQTHEPILPTDTLKITLDCTTDIFTIHLDYTSLDLTQQANHSQSDNEKDNTSQICSQPTLTHTALTRSSYLVALQARYDALFPKIQQSASTPECSHYSRAAGGCSMRDWMDGAGSPLPADEKD